MVCPPAESCGAQPAAEDNRSEADAPELGPRPLGTKPRRKGASSPRKCSFPLKKITAENLCNVLANTSHPARGRVGSGHERLVSFLRDSPLHVSASVAPASPVLVEKRGSCGRPCSPGDRGLRNGSNAGRIRAKPRRSRGIFTFVHAAIMSSHSKGTWRVTQREFGS